MNAKERHRHVLIDYLGNPGNKFLSRGELACEVLGFKQTQQIYKVFSLDELVEIEREALLLRRARYAAFMARADQALLKQAAEGDVRAVKLAYQRFEGWGESQTLTATCDVSLSLEVVFVDGPDASVEDDK